MLDTINLHDRQVLKISKYYRKEKCHNRLAKAIVQADDKLIPLNLREIQDQRRTKLQQDTWQGKAIHGKFVNEMTMEYVDQARSHEWRRKAGIFPETEPSCSPYKTRWFPQEIIEK